MEYIIGALLVAVFSYFIFKLGNSVERTQDPYTFPKKSNKAIKIIFFMILLALVGGLIILSA